MLSSIASVLVALIFLILSTRSDVLIEPCSVLTITSEEINVTEYYNVSECCDNWCLMNCTKTIPVVTNKTIYMQVSKCCPGYGGDDCLPECNSMCNSNQLCTAPNTCSCSNGWMGEDCAQVDGLTVTNVEARSISLQWLRANNDNVNGFLIMWSYTGGSQNKTIDADTNTTIITGLAPHIKYHCCVVPLLISGNGTITCVQQVTLQAEPSTYPSLEFSYIGSSVLVAKWDFPAVPNGIIEHYTLYINYSGLNNISVYKVDSQFNLFSIADLTQNQLVGVSISASTVIGEGPLSPMLFGTTSMDGDNTTISVTEQGRFEIGTTNVTQIRWTSPEDIRMEVMIKYYVVTLIKMKEMTQLAQWTLARDQVLDISIILDPYVPYQLNSIVLIENGVTGIFNSLVFFTKEGVPSTYPLIKERRRETPSSIVVTWKELLLTESRGHIINYVISYGATSGSCDNVLPLTSTNTSKTIVTLDNLDVQMDYCVRVAGATIAGVGPWSDLLLVNVFPYEVFTIYFSGVGSCQTWLETDALYKAENLTQLLSGIISKDCLCQFNYEHIGEGRFHCIESNRDIVAFTGRIVGTAMSSSSEILIMLQKWIDEGANVPLYGLQLQVINNCSVHGNSDTCTPSFESPEVIEPICNTVGEIVLAILFAITLVLLIFTCVILWTCFFYYRRKESKSVKSSYCSVNMHDCRKNSLYKEDDGT